jgi:hypothetical protein
MSQYQNVKKGWVEVDGKTMYMKSMWEIYYCAYLSHLKKMGKILEYHYEPDTFWFDGIKRGTNNYKPDFLVEHTNGALEYVEVKGYTTPKDKTKWKRMAKYYPNINLRIADKEFFQANMKTLKILVNALKF